MLHRIQETLKNAWAGANQFIDKLKIGNLGGRKVEDITKSKGLEKKIHVEMKPRGMQVHNPEEINDFIKVNFLGEGQISTNLSKIEEFKKKFPNTNLKDSLDQVENLSPGQRELLNSISKFL